ncbi:MAG: hypothetical protein BroJett018_36220 [Chloroflexota bacterium]|nr:WD40 repeat domain-containing protein [Chloroflexota bacterium]GIK65828.1 MAG: hypothetical protein BroJett018_36220 [Chloroflexota bacterium]
MKSKLLSLICTFIMSLMVVPTTTSSPPRQDDDRVRITPENITMVNPIRFFEGNQEVIFDIEFDPTSTFLSSLSLARDGKVWDVNSGTELTEAEGYPIAFGPNGLLAYGVLTEVVTNMDLPNPVFTGHQANILNIAFSPMGDLLATSSEDNTVRIWEINSGIQTITLRGAMGFLDTLRFSPDGSVLAMTNSPAQEIRLWKTQSESNRQYLVPGFAPIAFAPDASKIAFANEGYTVTIKNIHGILNEVAEAEITLKGHRAVITDIEFSPDGLLIATASEDSTISLWDAITGEEIIILLGHTAPVNSLAFSPDGSLLVSGSDDRSLRVWDLTTGDTLAILNGHNAQVEDITFSPDGVFIASGGADRYVIIWGIGQAIALPPVEEITPLQSPLFRINNYEAICSNPAGGGDWPTSSLPYTAYPPNDLPAEVQSTLETGIDVIICHAYSTLRIENCHYLGPGNYSYIYIRYRTDDTVQLVNYQTGQVITQRKFEGADPPACPDEIIRGEIYGDPPTPDDWLFWALDELYQR